MVLDAAGHYSRPQTGEAPFNAQHFLLEHYSQTGTD
jgi:hypothetical protein